MKKRNFILLIVGLSLVACNSTDKQQQAKEKIPTPVVVQIDTTNVLVATICQNYKWGFIDTDFKPIISPQFDKALGFSEGLAAVKSGNKWGFVNLKGEFVIQPAYDEPGEFHEGLAMVGNMAGNGNGSMRYFFISTKGENVFNAEYHHALDFNNGSTEVQDANGQYFYLDIKGNKVSQPNREIYNHYKCLIQPYGGQITKSLQFDKKGNPVGVNMDKTNYGYMNELGNALTDPVYCFAGEFRYSYKTPAKYLSTNAKDTIIETDSNYKKITATFKKVEIEDSEEGGTSIIFVQEDGQEIIFNGYNPKNTLIPILFCDPKSSKASVGRKYKVAYSIQNVEAEGGGTKELKILEAADRI